MASFHLWNKQTLVKFAEEASIRMEEQDILIAHLRVQLTREQVKAELAKFVASDTLPPNGQATPHS